jgi:transglutaminase-like putative cysteine protease
MRGLFFLLVFLSFSYAMFGQSTIEIERTWTITDGGGQVDFKGALAVNNSNQHIVSYTVTEGAETFYDEQGTLWVRYRGYANHSLQITARAVVQTDFKTNLTSDPPVPEGKKPPSELTYYGGNISSQAESLAVSNSSLGTITKLVNWVGEYVTYDEGYWDKIKSAQDVFDERRGVCVHYTHLLISMARSLGFNTRYVSGYVYIFGWQPHSWAEIYVPGYGWLPADATMGQAGDLDSTHVILSYGEDQLSVYDSLLSQHSNSSLSVDDKLTLLDITNDSAGSVVSISFEPEQYSVLVNISNSADEYMLGSYTFTMPESYGSSHSQVFLLEPGSSEMKYYGLNYSLFNNSHSYTIPISASFNDARAERSVQLNRTAPSCISAAVVSLVLLALLRK